MKLSALKNTKKLKYGSLAVAFIAVVVAAIILFNVVFTALAEKYGFYLDLTSSNLYGITDDGIGLLQDAFDSFTKQNKEVPKVKIMFMQPLDVLQSSTSYNLVINCAEAIDREFDNVEIEYFDIISHPEAVKKYTDYGYQPKTTSVIIESELGMRLFTFESCFVTNEDGSLYAFQGEMKFVAAILGVTNENVPVATFTIGHGEAKDVWLEQMFLNSGYEIQYKNLAIDEIDERTLVLVINNPTTDFLGITASAGGISEIDKIADFLNNFKNVMFFTSPEAPKLPELSGLLEEWGIELLHQHIISDASQSVPGNVNNLICDYTTQNDETKIYANALTYKLTGVTNPIMTVANRAVPLKILYETKGDTRTVQSVLSTSKNAYIQNWNDQIGDYETENGVFNVMTISTKYDYKNNERVYAHLLVCGTSNFTSSDITGDTYGNSHIMYQAIKLFSQEFVRVPVGIESKKVENYTLTIEAETAKTVGIVVSTVLPMLICIAGCFVWLRRRHL